MSEKMTIEELQAMEPVDLLKIVAEATVTETVGVLNEKLRVLMEDDTLSLEDGLAEVTCAAPVPFGRLKSRHDLGDLGVRITVKMEVMDLKAWAIARRGS